MTNTNNADKVVAKYNSLQKSLNQALPAIVSHRKKRAAAALSDLGIPTKKLEDYKRSDLNTLFDKEIKLSIELDKDQAKLPKEETERLFEKYAIPQLDTYKTIFFNDQLLPLQKEDHLDLPKGAFIGSLTDFLALYPEKEEMIASHYGRIAKSSTDGLVALNTIFVQDVLLIYLPKGVVLPKALHLIQVMKASCDLYASTRFLILLEEQAEALVVLNDFMGNEHQYLTNRVIEIAVKKGATLKLYDLENSQGANHKLSTIVVHQEEESHVTVGEYTLGNGFTRNNYRSRFLGKNAELKLNGLVIGRGDSHIDNFSRVEHIAPQCFTDENFKYLLKDDSLGSFTGRIFIAQGAEQTVAYQQDRNLLLSPNARAFAKPFLEIYADDVRCSHGMTTGQLDEDALLYMQQRGIRYEDARVMLCIAFAKDIIDRIELDPLREHILEIIEKDFYGDQYEDKKTL